MRLAAVLLLLAGCSAPSRAKPVTGVPQPWKEYRLTVDGKERTYYMVVPNSARPPHPVLVFLHGLDGDLPDPERTGRQYRFIAEKANSLGFLAVYPRGLAGSSPTLPRSLAWVGDTERERRNRRFLQVLYEDLAAKRSIDRSRAVLAGFANGAQLAAKELLERPDSPYTAFWFEAGGLTDELQTAARRDAFRPVFISIASDDWNNYRPTLVLRDKLLRSGWENGRTLRYVEHEGGHRLQEEGFEQLWRFLTQRSS